MRKSSVIALMVFAVACGSPADSTASSSTTSSTVVTSVPPRTTTTTVGATTTSQVESEDPGVVMVIGDWGSGTAPQGAVAGAMSRFAEEREIAAILTAGDNFYSDDAEFLMAPMNWATQSGIDFWLTWGNHDIETSRREDIVNETFNSPPRWTTHLWGDATIVILDSNQIGNQTQISFLEQTMEEVNGPTIVVFHHPAYSCSKHGDTERVQDEWVEFFDSDVVLVISGHDHNYQRISADGLTYLVTGGGGRHLYGLEPCDYDLVKSQELHHFLTLEQVDGTIVVTALDVLGDPIDSFEVTYPGG